MRLNGVAENRGLLQVSWAQREELERWAQSRALPAGNVFRARLILSLAEGVSYREIERTLGASAPRISKWKRRFEESGMAGLQGQHKGSQPRTATPAVQARILRRAQQKPVDGSTHWSCRPRRLRLDSSRPFWSVQSRIFRRVSGYVALCPEPLASAHASAPVRNPAGWRHLAQFRLPRELVRSRTRAAADETAIRKGPVLRPQAHRSWT